MIWATKSDSNKRKLSLKKVRDVRKEKDKEIWSKKSIENFKKRHNIVEDNERKYEVNGNTVK